MRRPPRTRAALVAVTALLSASYVVVSTTSVHAAAAPDFLAYQSSTPYAPLFSIDSACADATTIDSMDATDRAAEITRLAGWYRYINSQAATSFPLGSSCEGTGSEPVASLLAAAGVTVSNYRNGSFVSQSGIGQLNFTEASNLETVAPASILTFWPGDALAVTSTSAALLAAPLTSTATTVTVSASGSAIPAAAAATWPYVDSRGTGLTPGAHSTDTENFVSWIRVDNEIMQVVAAPVLSGNDVKLTVVRGLWGTAAASHSANGKVFSPVYSGSSSVVPSDAGLGGAPSRDDPDYPLRYVLAIWQPAADTWIAGRISATFSGQGDNEVWSDVSGCDEYSFAAADGSTVSGWNAPAATALTDETWGADQVTKLTALRKDVKGYEFSANSVLAEGDNLACDESILSSYDSGSLENWMNANSTQTSTTFDFAQQMQESFDIQANNWPAIYWPRWDLDPVGSASAAQYERFAYGAFLLSDTPGARRDAFGDEFGLASPDPLTFWDWGTPKAATTTLSDVAIAGTPLYGRQFANGLILVNPTSQAYTYTLPAAGYDVIHETGGAPTAVTSIRVQPDDAAFILQPGATTENLSVADTSVVRPASGTGSAVFTVSLPKASSTTVTAHYSTAGDTAVSGTDFTPTSGTVTIPAGSTSTTIPIPVVGNSVYHPATQRFWLNLSAPTGTTLERAAAEATITNPAKLPGLSVPSITVMRFTNAGETAPFEVTASNPSDAVMSVHYATADGTARAGVDYTAVSGTAFIPAGSTMTKVAVPVLPDSSDDGPVTLKLVLSSPSGATIRSSTGVATLEKPS